MMVELSVANPMLSPIAVDGKAAAALFGLSLRTWQRYNSAGICPAPIRLSDSAVRWIVQDLQAWAAHGCPSRVVWEERRRAIRRSEIPT